MTCASSRWGRTPFNGPRASRRTVEAAGLQYVHMNGLGNLGYKRDTIEIADIDAIEEVVDELRSGRSVALLCVCAKPEGCHRWTLAQEAVRRLPGLNVVHL